LGDWSDALVIGHVARLVPVKNQALLLRAFQQVAQRVPRTRLVILGDGPLRAELVAQSADLGITDKIRFVGAVADVAPWLREFDVVALSSNAEGMSISILEALATGLCVVATNVGGNGELLDHGRAGRLVPPGDVSAFADALTAVLTNEPLRVRLGRAGRAHVERHYGDATMVDAYEQLYRGVLPEHG
jgi:glycosyltransferase involved in cell wall biosynthesis